MSETATVVRALYDRITTTGSLDLGDWQRLKDEHRLTPEQAEAVLLATVGHLCTMAGELTAEVGRLSHALHRRSG